MVQRKTPDKLGIKDDSKNHVKSEKKSSSTTTTPSPESKSSKGGGPELKKMMKKSRSIKRSEFDCLRSRAKARHDKPTPPPANTPQKPSLVMVTPQKPPQVKIPETSSPPNYMKSTSSSIARKELSQVSPHGSKTSFDSKSPGRKDLDHPKLSTVSGHKPGKTLMKTSSLRPVRTLTKTSSNKAGRTSMKKNSGRTLYTDQKVRRATCSSTLKDTKFPTYVTLHPGGTESEGTSVMKVCPYTYCSLNGHHHAPLPPLKCFLSARRHLLKTQKSMRLKSLSSGGRKPSAKPKKDIDTGQMILNEDPAIPEEDFTGSPSSPLIKEEDLDFFVEIYAQPREDTSKSKGRNGNDVNEEAKKDFSVDPSGFENTSYSSKDNAATAVENDGGQYAESLPDESSHSATSFEDNIDQDIDFIMAELDSSMFFTQYMQMEEADDGDYSPYYTQAGSALGDSSAQNESGESDIDYSIFDMIGMDWDEGEDVDTHLDSKADASIVNTDEHDPILCLRQGSKDPELHDELMFKPDVINCYAEVTANEEVQVVHGENIEYLNEDFDGVDQALEIDISSAISSGVEENLEVDELITNGVSTDAAEYPLEEPTQSLLEYEKSTCCTNVKDESHFEEQEDNSSEPEIHQGSAPEAPVGAENGMCSQEPEHNETDQGVATSQDLNLNEAFPVTDANIGEAKEAEYDEHQVEVKERDIHSSTISDDHSSTEEINLISVENCKTRSVKMESEDGTGCKGTPTINSGGNPDQESLRNCSKFNKPIRCKKHIEDPAEPREFNPRGPRFLPLEPEVDPETVDLRHQMMDERRNSEEWMLDYALRQAVSKLAPARKRKVALLVEAFETVSPLAKFDYHLPHTPTGFGHTQFMQACS